MRDLLLGRLGQRTQSPKAPQDLLGLGQRVGRLQDSGEQLGVGVPVGSLSSPPLVPKYP